MITAFLIAALAVAQPTADQVDLIEVNHYFDQQGRLVLDQVIFWDWNREKRRHDVVAWRLLKNERQLPFCDWKRSGYRAFWKDGGIIRSVRARAAFETWTQYDPELEHRKLLPVEQRRGLTRRPKHDQ